MRKPIPISAAQKCINALREAGYLSYFDYIQFPSALNSFPSQTNVINGVQATNTNTAGYVWQKRTGFIPLGTTGYIDTNFNPTAGGLNYAKDDCHLGVYILSNTAINSVDFGSYTGVANGTWLSTRYGNNHTFSRLNAGTSADHGIIISDSRGYITAERSNATQEKIYRNGVLLATTANISTAIPNVELWAGALNNNGTVLLPGNKGIGLLTVGKSGVNNATVVSIFRQYFRDINYPLLTTYICGDSMVHTNATNNFTGWGGIFAQKLYHNIVDLSSAGQTVTTGTDNPFNPSVIPTYNSEYDGYLIDAHGVNDCWKTHDGGSPATTTRFQSDLGSNFISQATSKGWPASRIKGVCGYWLSDNAWFTRNTYLTYCDAFNSTFTSNGMQSIDLRSYTWGLSPDLVHPANDASHENIGGNVYMSFML